MDWDQLKSFHYIAMCGSISKAVGAVHRSQPAISRQLRLLEERLDCTLFERVGKRHMVLTAAGERLHAFTQNLFNQSSELFDDLAVLKAGGSGGLRIAAPSATLGLMLAEPLALFGQHHPRVAVSLLDRAPSAAFELLAKGWVDFAHCMGSQAPEQYAVHAWLKGHYMLITPKDHPLARTQKPRLEDIAAYPFIKLLSNMRFGSASNIDKVAFNQGVKLTVLLECGNIYVAGEYIRRGLGVGIAFVPERGLDFFPGSLEYVNVDHIFPPDTAVICCRKDTERSPSAELYLEHLLTWGGGGHLSSG